MFTEKNSGYSSFYSSTVFTWIKRRRYSEICVGRNARPYQRSRKLSEILTYYVATKKKIQT